MKELLCKAVLLDLDGTLIDSTSAIEQAWHQWASQRGLPVESVLGIATGFRSVDTIRQAAPHLDADKEAAALEVIEVNNLDGVYPFPGAVELLTGLADGPWAIVTSGSYHLATNRIRHAGLPMPQILITADDVERGKPDPQGYLLAATHLGIGAGDCLVFEDSHPGIAAGKNANMRVVAVIRSYPEKQPVDADWVISGFENVMLERSQEGFKVTLLNFHEPKNVIEA